MPLRDEVIDLIVTSPPYANAIDYMRAHKFPLVWLGESVVNLTELRARYIGSEKINGAQYAELPDKTESIIRATGKAGQEKVIHIAEILHRDAGGAGGNVSCASQRLSRHCRCRAVHYARYCDVQTHHCLAEIAQETGFSVIGCGAAQPGQKQAHDARALWEENRFHDRAADARRICHWPSKTRVAQAYRRGGGGG